MLCIMFGCCGTFSDSEKRVKDELDNLAIREICQTLNDYEAVFPGTNLRLFFKTATAVTATDQEF